MRYIARIFCLICALVVFVGTTTAQRNEFYLKDGDRVVFYGDSITEQRLYTTFVETYVVTRWPELNITFVNAGWGGDRVSGGRGGSIDVRLNRDVFAHQPTVVTIMLGMNDGEVKPYDPVIFNTFSTGYKKIVERLKGTQPGLRLTLIRPSPYDDVTRDPAFDAGYNSVLVRYGDFVEELARQMKLDVADLNQTVVAALTKAKEIDATLARRIIPDRVHPAPAGHLLMAQALLTAWKAAPTVSSVEIDAAKSRVTKAENSKVTELNNKGELSWTQSDKALPMFIDLNDPAIALAVKSSDVMDALNQQLLKVTGLDGPNYTLKIDDESVGTFSRESLSQGINLAALSTPMVKQARAVHLLTIEHNGIQRARWRDVQVALQDERLPAVQQALDALGLLDGELIKRQRATAKPRPRRFQLVPQS